METKEKQRGKGGESLPVRGTYKNIKAITKVVITSSNSKKFYYIATVRLRSDKKTSLLNVRCSLPINELSMFKKTFAKVIV